MPYFSIVIPTYNRAHIIARAIESVMTQSYEDWELIIVDDGSADDTENVINTYQDDRIKYFKQENAERGAARNNGTKNATGKYIFFLDSDDSIAQNYLEHAKQELNRLNEPEFFHIRYSEVVGESKTPAPALNAKTILEQTFKQNRFACQIILRKDIAGQFPFSENRDLKIGEDWGVILKIAVRYPLHFSNQHLGFINHGDRSMEVAASETVATSKIALIEFLKEDEKITEQIIKNVTFEFDYLKVLSLSIEKKRGKAFSAIIGLIFRKPQLLFKRRTAAIFKHILLP